MPSTEISYATRNNENFAGYLAAPAGDAKATGLLLITAISEIEETWMMLPPPASFM